LDLINDFVKKDGYETVLIDSSKEALELITSIKPELVILDVIMPDINGLDVIRKIRMNPETRKIKVIMVSALGTGIKLMLEKETQADYYLSKPFSGNELRRIIDLLLNYSEDEACWVNYNEIRKVARIHKENCIHCTPTKYSKNVVWKKYVSLEKARRDQEMKYSDYSWTPCRICMKPDNKPTIDETSH
jgi:DNA-binding response OmpR family regulator